VLDARAGVVAASITAVLERASRLRTPVNR
jgi:hypothetical protein